MAKKYTKKEVMRYIPKLKMDYKQSKVYLNMDNEAKETVDTYFRDKVDNEASDILSKLNLNTPSGRGRKNSYLVDAILQGDRTEAPVLIYDKMIKSKSIKSKDEEETIDRIENIISNLNLSSLSELHDKRKEQKIIKTIEYKEQIEKFGSKEDKAIVSEIISSLKKEQIEELDKHSNSLRLHQMERISTSLLGKANVVFDLEDPKSMELFSNSETYFENTTKKGLKAYYQDIIDYGEMVGFIKTKQMDESHIVIAKTI